MDFKCTCLNSGTNSFTGHCDRCGMGKPSNGTIVNINTIEPVTWVDVFSNAETLINSLQRYDGTYDQGVMEDKEGEYIKLEDVLSLFSREKE